MFKAELDEVHVHPCIFVIYVYRGNSSLVLDAGARGSLSRVYGHEGVVATTMKVTVLPRPEKMLQAINALEDGKSG